MAQVSISHTAVRLNLDNNVVKQQKGDARFIKDCTLDIEISSGDNNMQQGNALVRKPSIGNRLVENIYYDNWRLPQGENKAIGAFEFVELGEVYWFVYNSEREHTINFIDKNANIASEVIKSKCLNFQLDKQYSIAESSVSIRIVYDVNENTGVKTIKEKFLIFTDGYNETRQINVLASIATNSFTTPYFSNYVDSYCSYVSLAVLAPLHCINYELISTEKKSSNKLYKKSIQLAYQFVYVDNRESTISPYSDLIQVGYDGCNQSIESLPSCAKLKIWVGSPLVEKIILYKRECNADWTLYDVINKHNVSSIEKNDWWNRSDEWSKNNFDKNNRIIEYVFCNDKSCGIVDQYMFANIQNDSPIISKALTLAGDRLLAANNLINFDNLSQTQKQAFTLNTTSKQIDKQCTLPKRKVRVFMKIQGDRSLSLLHPQNWNSFLFKDVNEPNKTGKFYWGGLCKSPSSIAHPISQVITDTSYKNYNQYVPSEVGGFVATLNNVHVSISKQVKWYSNTSYEEIGVIPIVLSDIDKNNNGSLDTVVEELYNQDYAIMQMFEFEVDAGYYTFRVHNHVNGLNGDFAKTSTYINGAWNTTGALSNNQLVEIKDFEWIIDVRNKDYDSFVDGNGDYIILNDLTCPTRSTSNGYVNRVVEVKLYEDEDFEYPIQGSTIYAKKKIDLTPQQMNFTDHNGFSFYRILKQSQLFASGITYSIVSSKIVHEGSPVYESSVYGYLVNEKCVTTMKFNDFNFNNSASHGLAYNNKVNAQTIKDKCARIIVRGYVKDSDGNGIAGLYVWTEFAQGVFTDIYGKYEIIVYQQFPTDYRFVNRNIYIDNNNSICGAYKIGCLPLDRTAYIATKTCVVCEEIEIKIPSIVAEKFNKSTNNSFGVNGRFAVGVAYWDAYGRGSFVNKIGDVEIQDYNSINTINWQYDNNVALPSRAKYVTFFITKNLDGDILEWAADEVKALDINGNTITNTQNAAYIMFDISSLVNYNLKHNTTGTNVSYQYVDNDFITILSDGKKDLIKEIKVKITGSTINNENKTVTETTQVGTTTTATQTIGTSETGNKIIIPYDDALKMIVGKCSVKIRITRPYKCDDVYRQFFELCGVYKVINGKLLITEGKINYSNTYNVYRNIFISKCTNSYTTKKFNSLYPSDFINKNCISKGRVNIENEFAESTWQENEIAESDSWINNGKIFGYNNFRKENRFNTKSQEFGGIVALFCERNIILAVCLNDWFTCSYNVQYLRATTAGAIEVPLNSRISEPNQKIGNRYGCEHNHKQTVQIANDVVFWYDVKNSKLVGCTFNGLTDVSMDGVQSYFLEKTEYLKNANKDIEVLEVIGGYDVKTNSIITTFIHNNATNNYVNNNRQIVIEDNETIVFSVKNKFWSEFRGFTPELYSKHRNSSLGEMLISFADGYPYLHNTKLQNKRCNYFDKQVQPVIEIVINYMENKVKHYQAIAQNIKDNPFILERVYTEQWNSYSYIPKAYWKEKEDVWYSEILRDMTGFNDTNKKSIVSQLINGKRVRGRWAIFRFIQPLDDAHKYWELSNFYFTIIGSELSQRKQVE